MKKYTILLAIALLSACTKSEVTYSEPEAIAIAPVTANMTKGAVSGIPKGQDLLVYANYWDKSGDVTGEKHGSPYLNGAVFSNVQDTDSWTGKDETYFWPKSGEITLSGCTYYGGVEYSFADNKIKVKEYVQPLDPSKTVDFLWFNQTAPTNLDRQNGSLDVVMNHALTWVTIQVQGLGGSLGWKVESIVLKDLLNQSELLTCTTDEDGNGIAEWATPFKEGPNQFAVYQAPEKGEKFILTESPRVIENQTAGTVLLPQKPVKMDVSYYTTASTLETPLRIKELDLRISDDDDKNFWEAGKHYIYTITFNPYKISFEVNEDGWGDDPENDKDINNYVDGEIIP